jgi:proteasome activator subunit 4
VCLLEAVMGEEDRENISGRVKRLGFKPQREIVYCKLLPYANQLDEESVRMLSEIKANLGRAVMMREMRPGCGMWTTRLSKYDVIPFRSNYKIFIVLWWQLLMK